MEFFSTILSPQAEGLTCYWVRFQRLESAPVPSMLAEGQRYRHPAGEQTAMVWAADEAGIAAVLTWHYQDTWHSLVVLTMAEKEAVARSWLEARRTA